MTGRHRGAHRDEASERGRRVAQISTLLLLGVVGWAVIRAVTGTDGCDGNLRLTVVASPEIAPAVQQTAEAWAKQAVAPGGECVFVAVTPVASADLAATVARTSGATLRGAVEPSSAASGAATLVPDVWIPDSSSWLVRLRAAAPGLVPDSATPIASSPVVLGVPEPIAATLGWPTAATTWLGLLQKITGGTPLRVGIVDPTRDAAGLSGLIALGAAARTGAGQGGGTAAQAATVAAMRALVSGRTQGVADLLARYPTAATADALAAALGAAPLSEQALIAFNAGSPRVPLAALYPTPAPAALDFPYVVMPRLDQNRATLAVGLRAALSGGSYASRLAAAGLRAADGTADFVVPPGAPTTIAATVAPAKADAAAVTGAVGSWISVTMPARMLAVIDISSSMLTPVPTAGGATRSQISVAAARQGMTLFDDTWSVGLWTFSTNLDRGKDYKQLVPIGPMKTTRAALLSALATVTPKEGGETGLYDTVLAAYESVQQGWDGQAVNSVVILTDGINRDANGLTLPQLLAALQRTVDPARPIQVIAIGIGDQVSEAELKQIVAVSGGGVFIARDPSAIGEIFLKAIALRPSIAP